MPSNLEAINHDLLEELKALIVPGYDDAEGDCLFCGFEQAVAEPDDPANHSHDCRLMKAKAAIAKAERALPF